MNVPKSTEKVKNSELQSWKKFRTYASPFSEEHCLHLQQDGFLDKGDSTDLDKKLCNQSK
jgi:hypothetical protein